MIPVEELMRWGEMGGVNECGATSDWERMWMSSGSSSSSLMEEWVATEIAVVVVGVVGAVVGLVMVIVGEGLVCMMACRMAVRLVGSVLPSRVVRAVGSLPKRVVKRVERSGCVGGGSDMLGWAGWWGEE